MPEADLEQSWDLIYDDSELVHNMAAPSPHRIVPEL